NRTAEKSTEERILNDRPAYPEGVPAPLTAILSRTLQKSYADRYSSAAELKADLVAFLEGRPISPATEARPSAFGLPGEAVDLDEEKTQRTHRLPADDLTITPSDDIRTAILSDAEATQRTELAAAAPEPALTLEAQPAPQGPAPPAAPVRAPLFHRSA